MLLFARNFIITMCILMPALANNPKNVKDNNNTHYEDDEYYYDDEDDYEDDEPEYYRSEDKENASDNIDEDDEMTTMWMKRTRSTMTAFTSLASPDRERRGRTRRRIWPRRGLSVKKARLERWRYKTPKVLCAKHRSITLYTVLDVLISQLRMCFMIPKWIRLTLLSSADTFHITSSYR